MTLPRETPERPLIAASIMRLSENVDQLLAKAPEAVDSFHPGHWALLCGLEQRAQALVRERKVGEAIVFLTDVAYLKQPYRIDQDQKAKIRERLAQEPQNLSEALEALADIERRDYRAMTALAKLPYFGLHGGRAFNSAVVRVVCPAKFAIIDWRNLAVLSNAEGFEGLVESPVNFKGFPPDRIVEERGHLLCPQGLYEQYNNIIRDMAASHGLKAAEVDLALWTYSVQQKPFGSYHQQESLFDRIFGFLARTDVRQRPKGAERNNQVTSFTQSYINALKDLGWLSPERVRVELSALFRFVRDECEAYGRNKPRIRLKIKRITLALETGVKASRGERLLAQWKRWEDMLNPASPIYIGIDLPGSMVMEGYVVFENLVPIREYFEKRYTDSSFDPTEASETSFV